MMIYACVYVHLVHIYTFQILALKYTIIIIIMLNVCSKTHKHVYKCMYVC